MERRVPEHEHPLRLRDLVKEYEEYEDEHEEEEDIEDIIIPQDFRSTCRQCGKEIHWFHRYFYECAHSCDFKLHKFCAELPATINHKLHNSHTLTLFRTDYLSEYRCLKCNFSISVRHAMVTTEYQIIHHPSHPHPLVPLSKPISSECDACGKKHEGIFYLCTTCFGLFIHEACAFLPKKLFIQEITKNNFSHCHPLTLSYSFPQEERIAKLNPRCRVCHFLFDNFNENLWILKCEKCRYYAHLRCATSAGGDSSSSFGKQMIQNFKDSDYPDLLRLPFPTASDSILKRLFSNQVGCEKFKMEDGNTKHYKCHPHPLILVRTQPGNDITTPSSSTTIVCHDPMKKIELLCNGCIRPITSMPFYKCADVDNKCDFVVHDWCIRLPDQIHNYMDHKQHTLVLQPNASNKFFSVFVCAVCELLCNGFVYTCVECDDYHVDVICAFIPEKITHEVHLGHLMSMVTYPSSMTCRVCPDSRDNQFAFRCDTCSDVWVHAKCAMLLPREIKHKYDKHPMSISYTPIENHKSQYFCEICEEEFDPELCFYHCYQCAQSVHTHCAPLILQSERATAMYDEFHYGKYNGPGVYEFVNIKFGGMLHNVKDHHPHPLIFDQGIESDGNCSNCGRNKLKGKMIFKCQQCSRYAIDMDCCKRLSSS